ncbi:MAG: hypothetical protein AAFZ52_14740 [Bacteroidota bacterium]
MPPGNGSAAVHFLGFGSSGNSVLAVYDVVIFKRTGEYRRLMKQD